MRKWYHLPFMIVYAIILHWLYAGVLILIDDDRQLTAVALIGGFGNLINSIGVIGTAFLLFSVATIAACGILVETKASNKFMMACLMPQFMVLLYAFFTSVESIVFGLEITSQTTGQLVQVPLITLLFAIGPICIAAALHTLSILGLLLHPTPAEVQLEIVRRQNVYMKLVLARAGLAVPEDVPLEVEDWVEDWNGHWDEGDGNSVKEKVETAEVEKSGL